MDQILPSALQNWHHLTQRALNKKIILILDYDGTLAPIADKPELAVINNDKKAQLYELSQHYHTILVSGRLVAEKFNLIGIEDLYYIGNHGYDFKRPFLSASSLQQVADFSADINEAYIKLQLILGKIEEVFIEHKKWSLSIHFRLAKKELIEHIEAAVNTLTENQFRLRKHYAKKVFEIRPNINWDIGQAVSLIIDELNLDKDNLFPIYIGDDVTDEPGFEFVKSCGCGIIVATHYRPTLASYSLKNVNEVWDFLNKFKFH
jgi:trehalose 6-phosphate phosphatase